VTYPRWLVILRQPTAPLATVVASSATAPRLFNDAGFSQYVPAAERQKHLPELFQPRNLLIASKKPFRKISKRFFDATVSLSTVPSSVLEIH
jgi:hypothetical protein